MNKCTFFNSTVLFLLFIFLFSNIFAQKQGQEKIDSLISKLKTAKEDTSKVNILNGLGREFRNNDPEKAITYSKEALSLARKNNYENGIGTACIVIGTALSNLGQYELARKNLMEGLLVSKKVGDKTNEARAYNGIGNIFKDEGNYEEALINYSASKKIYESINDRKSIATIYNNIGVIYEYKGNYFEALKNYDPALKIREEIGDKEGISASYNNLGNIYYRLGNQAGAQKNYLASLKICEEIGNKNGVATAYNNIGSVYIFFHNYPSALKYQLASLKIKDEIGDKQGMAMSYNSIGIIYQYQKNYQEAIKSYSKSLQLSQEIGNKAGVAQAFNSMGAILQEEKNYPAALKNYFGSLKISVELDDQEHIGISNQYIGSIYMLMGDFILSRQYLENALKISKSINLKENTLETYLWLSRLDSSMAAFTFTPSKNKTEHWRNAYENYKQYSAIADSLLNESKIEEITRNKLNYEFEKKEIANKAEQDKKDSSAKAELEKQKLWRNSIAGGSAILLLSSIFIFHYYKRNRDSEEKRKEISNSLLISETEMKALQAQMNPHFIFNALNSIRNFLANHKSDETDTYIKKFQELMRFVLENSTSQEVPLIDDLSALRSYMEFERLRLEHPFTFEINVDDKIDQENIMIPPLILQPFVENAIWHGLQPKQEPGFIKINISMINDMITCIVEDNGVGRDLNKQVSEPMVIKKKSLGMKITEQRLKIYSSYKNVKAWFQIVDLFNPEQKPTGTRVELYLPLFA